MINKEEVKRIAKLARLELTEKEIEKMQKDLSAILDYFNLLKKAPKLAAAAPPIAEKGNLRLVREDRVIVQNPALVKKLIEASPDKKDNYIKVKAIL